MATYYISPTGNDGAAGGPTTPWKTFARAITPLVAGDTLILKNGTYDASNSGYLVMNGKNGSAGNLITIQAENERQAFISGNGNLPVNIVNCSYVAFIGIRARNIDGLVSGGYVGSPISVGNSHHMVFRRNLVHNNNRYYNGATMSFSQMNDSLVEENECYWYHRHGMDFSSSNNNIVRRNYLNSRDYPDLAGAYPSIPTNTGDSGFVVYPGSNNLFENNVTERTSGAFDIQALGTTVNNRYYGNIANRCVQGFKMNARSEIAGLNGMPRDTYIENCVIIGSTSVGFYLRTHKNAVVKNVTIIGSAVGGFLADLYGTFTGDGAPSVFGTNILSIDNTGNGFGISGQTSWGLNYCNSFNNSVNFSPAATDSHITNEFSVNPNLLGAKIWIPSGTPMKGAGLAGADIGANVIYRYQDGVITTTPLWGPSFPHGTIVAGVNDISGDSLYDIHLRLGLMPTPATPNPPTSGDVYYVSKTGNDANPGTSVSPKLTVLAGIGLLTAGDTLNIRSGTYTETIPNTAIPSGISDTVRTVIQGEVGNTVILNGQSAGVCLSVFNRSFITFSNLILDGVGETVNIGFMVQSGVGQPSSYITFKNSEVRNFNALDTGAVTASGTVNNSFLRYTNLSVHNNGLSHPRPPGPLGTHGIYVTAPGTIVEDCDIYNNNGFGIHIYLSSGGVNNCILRRNKLHANYSYGYMLSSGSGHLAYNNLVYGNGVVVVGAGGARIGFGATNCKIYNDTVYGNTGFGIRIEAESNGAIVKNTISHGNSGANFSNAGVNTVRSNNLDAGVDPLFVNAGAANFYLQASSPAINTGVPLGEVPEDYVLTGRPQGLAYDIGAYEYIVTSPGVPDTTPPTGIIIAPANGNTVTGNVTITCDASDNTGIANVQFYLDGSPLGGPVT